MNISAKHICKIYLAMLPPGDRIWKLDSNPPPWDDEARVLPLFLLLGNRNDSDNKTSRIK
jgi:hypothetical protein